MQFPSCVFRRKSQVLTQTTISKSPVGAIAKSSKNCSSDGNRAQGYVDGFVVPEDVLSEFTFPTDLSAVQMFVTVPNVFTQEALASLRSSKKHRTVIKIVLLRRANVLNRLTGAHNISCCWM